MLCGAITDDVGSRPCPLGLAPWAPSSSSYGCSLTAQQKSQNEGNKKVVWTLIIVCTHLIGAALFFFVRRPRRRAEAAS